MQQKNLLIKMALDAWFAQISRTNKVFQQLDDEQLKKEVSPGKNTGVYLLGHLAAVHDAMVPLLGLGEKAFPELEEVFVKNPDKSGLPKPAISYLRTCWTTANNRLETSFMALGVEDWFQKHTAVSLPDFEKEPHRNRLNVLLSRTIHIASHLGQLNLLT